MPNSDLARWQSACIGDRRHPYSSIEHMLLHGQQGSDEGRGLSPLAAESFVALLLFGLSFILGDQAGELGILLCKAGILGHCPP